MCMQVSCKANETIKTLYRKVDSLVKPELMKGGTATFKDDMISEKKKSVSNTKKAMKKIQDNQHQSTLGDLDSLSALKDDLEKGE